jgi:tRNA-2-methylthio-N6-dimethylallyladenosine synthase
MGRNAAGPLQTLVSPAPGWEYAGLATLVHSGFSTGFALRKLCADVLVMPSVFIRTYGCQMNERDSEALAAQLVARGYALAASEATADVVLLNTCSVRDLAEQKALGKMRALAWARQQCGREVILGFMGCMAQSRGQELIEAVPGVNLVLGTQKLHRAADYLDDLATGRCARVVDVGEEPDSEAKVNDHLLAKAGRWRPVTAFVSIMQGCNQRCTFCIVPHTRGAERSRPVSDIVAECRGLVELGVREVTLLGQTVTSYGKQQIPSRDGKSAFVQLLEAVHEIEGLERIRFTAAHPRGYGDDLLEAHGRLPKLCEHAHLPVQSGSDRVLKLMRRGYKREQFIEVVRKFRRVRSGAGVTTDFIVGFPGETEADFEETLALAREVEFDQAYVFKYSPRRATPAALMPGPVPKAVRDERHARLLALTNEIGRRKYAAYVGRRVQVLVEGPSHRNPARLEGRTRTNKIVVFEGAERWSGQLVDLDITRTGCFTLYGVPVSLNP